MRTILFILMGLMVVAGCSTERDPADFFAPSDVETVVIDAVLWVGRPFPSMWLTRTMAPDELFDPRVAAESGANVMIVFPDGTRVRYGETSLRGFYIPADHFGTLVQPETEYELRVVTANGELVTARTTTPARFSIDEWVLLNNEGTSVQRTLKTFEEFGDSVYFAPENQLIYTDGLLEGRFERQDVPGYHVGIFSIDLDSDFVFDPEFFEEEDFEDLERTISSPAFEALDGTVRLPWFAVFYQGRYKIRVYAVDQNWFDLILTLPEYTGGFGGTVGDNFNRPDFNVNGGIGLFGSASVDSVGFFVHPRPR